MGGTIERTFTIPAELHGTYQIAIRLQATTGGYYAYNWFYNMSTTTPATPVPTATLGPTATPGSTATPAPTATPSPTTQPAGGDVDYPWFTISAVTRDQSVVVNAHNLPPNRDFIVRMGPMGSRGIDGTVVATTASGSGGDLTATYPIPDGLKGSHLIAIRMDASGGYYAYNWFYNTTTP
jgi:hypothetical protein